MTTKYIGVDLDEWSSSELQQELIERGSGVPIRECEHEHLLRHGIEDRDWSKIEEFAEKLDVHFSKLMARK